jgi:pantothenate kinase-related protein Tda10
MYANRPLIVEFIGVTGSGKSTFVAAVTSALSEQSVSVVNAYDKILISRGFGFIKNAL